MELESRPVLVAYDGSAEADAAIRQSAALFARHRQVVASVWEPGLAMAMAPAYDPTGVGYVAPSGEDMAAVDRSQHDHAEDVAEAGARLARELGATAEPYPVPDEADVGATLAALAERIDACAVVIGSRGRGGLKAKLLGSASSELLRRSRRPVVVVRAPD